jgi:hypothetical protein
MTTPAQPHANIRSILVTVAADFLVEASSPITVIRDCADGPLSTNED